VTDAALPPRPLVQTTTYSIILAVSLCHLLNDVMQSLLAAIYPMLKDDFALDYWQIGMLTLVFQVTASLLQPVIGIYTDKHPLPMSLPIGMGSTFCGLLLLAFAPTYPVLLAGAALIGVGSAIFHPESSRVARMASGGRYGLAQSLFQVGGNFGTAAGPLLAAFIVLPFGRPSVAWFCLIALLGMAILHRVGGWYRRALVDAAGRKPASRALPLPRNRVIAALVVLALLTFSKNIYMASISSYYTFYLIETFDVTTQQSQLMLFLFLAAAAVGTVLGGPVGDRFGTMTVIWISILGVLPFTLLLPHANLFWSGVLSMIIGLVMASAFPAIVVFAQELLPGRVGMVAGIFFGFAFGMAGIAAAVLGILADSHGIDTVYAICAWLPALGILTVLLPRRKAFATGR
jgi:FSR family fosmidomycin resistance protein-like MFS transporter